MSELFKVKRIARQAGAKFLLLLAMLASSSQSIAQSLTEITGRIESNITLRAAQSPYTFQGAVVLGNDATMSVEPGVTIRMAQDASFTLQKGAFNAIGTSTKPIVITSAESTPAAGDWGTWRFTAGTNNSLTRLVYVHFEYGGGIAIEASSPQISNTIIHHHNAPAVIMDLESSPVGNGNSAYGNLLNAIVVPPGHIRNSITWGLLGIPYLVQQGLIHVGQGALAIKPTSLKLNPGTESSLQISIDTAAPSGGMTLDAGSSNPSVASTSTSIFIPEGQHSADLKVQANNLGLAKITVSHVSLGIAEAQVEVRDMPLLSLAPSSAVLNQGVRTAMTVCLPNPEARDVPVQLTVANPSVLNVSASVVLQAGQQCAGFDVTGLAAGATRLTAHAENFSSVLATLVVRGETTVSVPTDKRLLVSAARGESYFSQLSGQVVSSSSSSVVWMLAAGTLPEGLTLNAQGLISGVSTAANGYYKFAVQAFDPDSNVLESFDVEMGVGAVVLLMHFDGENFGTTFFEETGKNVSRSGTVLTMGDVKKLGTASVRFNGSGSMLHVPYSEDMNLSSSDFTIEFWLYLRAWSGTSLYGTVLSKRTSGADHDYSIINNDAEIGFQYASPTAGNAWFSMGLHDVAQNQWAHFAVSRLGNQLYSYRNGVEMNRVTLSRNLNNSALITQFGQSLGYGDSYLNANVDELRITKGVARYIGGFTPPTRASDFPR